MEEVICKYCGSENVYFSKKKQKYCCEDCEKEFIIEKKFVPQKIFISYGHDKNRDFVEEIKRKLVERGHNPWIDTAEIMPGSDWRSKISSGINNSNEFLAFISKHSVRQPGVCLDEIAIALGIPECIIQSIVLEKSVNPPNSISTNQWLDFSEWEDVKAKGEQIWNNWLDNKMETLFRVVENPENITKSGEIAEIKKKFQPITPDTTLKVLLRQNIVQRKWLLDYAKEWLKNKAKVFFLVGGPGTGKSIFCALLSNYLYNVVAIYFIDWKNADTQSVRNFILSITFQISCNVKDYREKVMRLLPDLKIETCSDITLCECLLIKPLNEMIDGNREKLVVVIDAMDEIREEYVSDYLTIVKKIIDEGPEWLRWIITSRPEVSILNSLQMYDPEYFDLHKEETSQDIKDYVKTEFEDEEVAAAIYQKCGGTFIYVNELVKRCKGRAVTASIINELPPNISALYFDNFERMIGKKYDEFYQKLLSLIIYAYEPLSTSFLSKYFQKTTMEISDKLKPLNSYITIMDHGKGEFVNIIHKSLIDWLTDKKTEKYYLDRQYAHSLFADFFLLLCDNGEILDPYMAEHGYDHLKSARKWLSINHKVRGKLLEKSILALKQYGLIVTEKHFLDIYKEDGYDQVKWAMLALDYSIRIYGETSKELCELVYKNSLSEEDAYRRYEMREKVAIAYFYLGKEKESYELLLKEKEENFALFSENPQMVATWNHSISLAAHNMDYNEQVVQTSQTSANLYMEQKKNYDYFISLVNLFDAYMGCGKLEEAEQCAKKVIELNKEKYFVHVDDILKICYANLLQVQGRIMEALQWYEEGLQLAKEIQSWDYLYGSIWRELAIAKFHDRTCLERLEKFIQASRRQSFSYLVSLGECFYVLSSWLLHCYDSDKLNLYSEEVKDFGLVGHCLQTEIAMQLICEEGTEIYRDEQATRDKVRECIQTAQGIKGLPEMVDYYFNSRQERLAQEEMQWHEKYVVPAVNYQHEYRDKLIARRTDDDTPLIKKVSCVGCEAKCCYDGVYLRSKEEEEKITELIKRFPESFLHIPEEYIVNGDWPGMENYRKTAVKKHQYISPDYPDHFTQTSCVFTMESGECLLQRVATDHQLHPWYAKPCACWSFPIRGFDKTNGTLVAPTNYGEQDPDYLDENYPGYVTFLPCGKPARPDKLGQKNVISWTKLLSNEIEYYDFVLR